MNRNDWYETLALLLGFDKLPEELNDLAEDLYKNGKSPGYASERIYLFIFGTHKNR